MMIINITKLFVQLTVLVFVHSVTLAQAQTPAVPYDMVIMGFDTEVGNKSADLIGILLVKDMESGFRFGLASDYLIEPTAFEQPSPTSIEFVYNGESNIARGAALKILNNDGAVTIFLDDQDITAEFSYTSHSSAPKVKLLKHTGTLLTLYAGYMIQSPDGQFIMGTILDMVGYGLHESTQASIKIPTPFMQKDIFVSDDDGSLGGNIDITDCDICEVLFAILDVENWIITSGTKGEDIAIFIYDIEDCIEVPCDGNLEIEVDSRSCAVVMVTSPCAEVASYKWYKTVSGVPMLIASGNGPNVPPLPITDQNGNGTYTLEITCADGCVYRDQVTVTCHEPSCTASLDVTSSDCTLTATVDGCTDFDIQWYYLQDGGTTVAGNTTVIEADQNALYYAVVTGCDNCPDLVSSYVEMDCGPQCECTTSAVVDECIITVTDDNCEGYSERWEVYDDEQNIWKLLSHTGLLYNAPEDGLYRRVLSHDECDDEIAQAEVNCQLTCHDFNAMAVVNQDCEIEITWTGCASTVVIFPLYAADPGTNCNTSSNFVAGGGQISYGSTSAIFTPSQGVTCYQLNINCGEDCIETIEIFYDNCCDGDLTIQESDCTLSAVNNPCTGTFTYEWYRDGIIVNSGISTNVPDLTISDNAAYSLEVTCSDGCMYPSNTLDGNCAPEECMSEVSLHVVDQCEIEVLVTNCPDALIVWQQLIDGVYVDMPAETSSNLIILADGSYRPLISNCPFCTADDLEQPVYQAEGCEEDCPCDITLTVDPSSCEIVSTNTDCSGIVFSFWEYENPPTSNNWVYIEECTGNCSYSPPFNGNFRKGIMLNDGCDVVYEETVIECVEDCNELSVIIEELTEDCYLKASWYNCFTYEQDNFGWYYTTNPETNCESSGYTPLPQPSGGVVKETYHNPATGEGYQIIDPEHGQGCYFFNIQCNETCEIVQEKHWWEENCCMGLEVEITGNVDNSCSDLTAVVTGGVEPITFLWSGVGTAGTVINQSNDMVDLSSLYSGEDIDLTIIVTDANGCQDEQLINYSTCDCLCDDVNECTSVLLVQAGNNDPLTLSLGYFTESTVLNWSFDPRKVADQLEITANSDIIINTGPTTNRSQCGCNNQSNCGCSTLFLGNHLGQENVMLDAGIADVSSNASSSNCANDETMPLQVLNTTLPNGLWGAVGGTFQTNAAGEVVAIVSPNSCGTQGTLWTVRISCGEVEPPLLEQKTSGDEKMEEFMSSNADAFADIPLDPSFTIHPNPAMNFFDITVKSETMHPQMQIRDTNGRLIKSDRLSFVNGRARISTEGIPSGVYYVVLSLEDHAIGYRKLVIIK